MQSFLFTGSCLNTFFFNAIFTVVLYVLCWLMRPWLKFASQISATKRNMKKIFLRRLSLGKFLAKLLRVNKIAMKSFLTSFSFGNDLKL